MFDRARWTNKPDEAKVFRQWLMDQLMDESQLPQGQPQKKTLPVGRRQQIGV